MPESSPPPSVPYVFAELSEGDLLTIEKAGLDPADFQVLALPVINGGIAQVAATAAPGGLLCLYLPVVIPSEVVADTAISSLVPDIHEATAMSANELLRKLARAQVRLLLPSEAFTQEFRPKEQTDGGEDPGGLD